MTDRARLTIVEEPPTSFEDYARVPIAFDVRAIVAIDAPDEKPGGANMSEGAGRIAESVTSRAGVPFAIAETPVAVPYRKDYDLLPENHPTDWPKRFDTGEWGILGAWREGRRVGGAVIAWATPGLEILEDRPDLAVLWDLRVSPEARRGGVGAALFAAAERWALGRGARQLKVETQNINVPACRFYAKQGCTLGAIHPFAYPALPDEVQMLWYKALGPHEPRASRT